MVRKSLLLAALVCVALCVGAVSIAAETTIVFWHWNREDRQAKLEPLIKQFEEETGIKVESQMVPWEELAQKLVVSMAGGVAPDVTAISSDRGMALLLQGFYEDLRPYMERETEYDFDDLLPNALEMWQSDDGQQLAFPFDLDVLSLFYNPTLFDGAGIPYPDADLTWEGTYDLAKRFTIDTDGDGRVDQHGFVNGFMVWDTLVWSYGGELLDPKGTNHALDSTEARAGLEMWRNLSQPDVNLDWGDAPTYGYPTPTHAFGAGRVAMVPIGAWGPSAFWQDPTTGEFVVDFDVTYIPRSEQHERGIPLAGQGLGLVAASQQKEAAWEFIKFMASAEVQEVSARDLGQFPVLRSVAVSDAFMVPDQPPANMHTVIESTLYARFHPKHRNWPDAWARMRTEVSRFVIGAASLSQVLQTLDDVVPSLLNR